MINLNWNWINSKISKYFRCVLTTLPATPFHHQPPPPVSPFRPLSFHRSDRWARARLMTTRSRRLSRDRKGKRWRHAGRKRGAAAGDEKSRRRHQVFVKRSSAEIEYPCQCRCPWCPWYPSHTADDGAKPVWRPWIIKNSPAGKKEREREGEWEAGWQEEEAKPNKCKHTQTFRQIPAISSAASHSFPATQSIISGHRFTYEHYNISIILWNLKNSLA